MWPLPAGRSRIGGLCQRAALFALAAHTICGLVSADDPSPADRAGGRERVQAFQPGEAADWPKQLPRDGAWIRYHWVYTGFNGITEPGSVTLSFVGTVVEQEQRFRWIEVKTTMSDGAATPT